MNKQYLTWNNLAEKITLDLMKCNWYNDLVNEILWNNEEFVDETFFNNELNQVILKEQISKVLKELIDVILINELSEKKDIDITQIIKELMPYIINHFNKAEILWLQKHKNLQGLIENLLYKKIESIAQKWNIDLSSEINLAFFGVKVAWEESFYKTLQWIYWNWEDDVQSISINTLKEKKKEISIEFHKQLKKQIDLKKIEWVII